MDRFKSQFSNPHTRGARITVAHCATEYNISEDVASTIQVHSPSFPPTVSMVPTPTEYPMTLLLHPAPDIAHLPDQLAPPPSSNGYADLYLSNSEDNSFFIEMVVNDKINPIKSISSCIISPLVVPNYPPPKVAKKRHKNLCRRQLTSIRRN